MLIIQIRHVIPEKWKSSYLYFYNKKISGKYFNFKLQYSFDFNYEEIDSNKIFLKLEEILKEQ
jgi:hypothetical protein